MIKTSERRQWRRFGVFIVHFEHISHLVLESLLLTLNMQLLAGKSFEKLFEKKNDAEKSRKNLTNKRF